MATIVGTTSTGLGVRYTLSTPQDNLFVPGSSYVVSTSGTAIQSFTSSHIVTVAGQVAADEDGISLGGGVGSANNIVSILQGGSITGGDDGVSLIGYSSQLRNYGSVSGVYGVSFYSGLSGGNEVFNAGTIDAVLTGVYVNEGPVKVVNLGTISGGAQAISANASADTVVNRGTLVGTVALADGSDLVDNRGGVIEGTVFLDLGSDRFIAGASVEEVYGGDGIDILDYSASRGVTVFLADTGLNRGVAEGDTYIEFENIWGSRRGNDVLSGDNLANALLGLGGADRLSGGRGADYLEGGLGKDTLKGGGGNDMFVFEETVIDAADKILDFHNTAGDNDIFHISSALGGGLSAGALAGNQFVQRADNHAQDAGDRFIFRTTDRTLWFDADGTGAGKAVMLADLQAGATMGAGDILII